MKAAACLMRCFLLLLAVCLAFQPDAAPISARRRAPVKPGQSRNPRTKPEPTPVAPQLETQL